jgi:hypothetical protein
MFFLKHGSRAPNLRAAHSRATTVGYMREGQTLLRQSEAGKIKILKLSPRRLGIRMSEINRYLDENVKPMKTT